MTKSAEVNFLKKAYNIYSSRFKTVLILTLFIYIPFYLLYFAGNSIGLKYITGSITISGINFLKSDIFSTVLVYTLNFIFTPIFMASMYFLVDKFLNDEKVNTKVIIRKVCKLYPFLLLSSVIYYFLIVCAVPFIILVPYILTIYYFYIFEICEGEKNPIKAFKKSHNNVRGKFFYTFAIILFVSILSSLLTNILDKLINVSNMPSNVVFYMYYNLINTIINAYFYVLISLWYKNRKNYSDEVKI